MWAYVLPNVSAAILVLATTQLGAAVLAWGLSFYHGCQLLQCLQVLTRAEGELLQAESGQHPKAGPEPWKHGATVEALKEVLERENMALGKHDVRQFRYLVAGAVLFVGWHVLQIVLRSTH